MCGENKRERPRNALTRTRTRTRTRTTTHTGETDERNVGVGKMMANFADDNQAPKSAQSYQCESEREVQRREGCRAVGERAELRDQASL